MKIVKLNPEQFNKFVSHHKYRNYYQTSQYANVIGRFGYKTQYIGITDDNNKLIGASLIIYKDVFMKNKIAYAPRGILFDYTNKNNVLELVKALRKSLGKQGFMILRIDPYIPLTIRDSSGTIMNINQEGSKIIKNLQEAEFSYKGKNLYFETEKPRWEALITLQKDVQEVFERLDKRNRNKIRRSINYGIVAIKDPSNNVNRIFNYIRDKEHFPIGYYEKIKKEFKDNLDIYLVKINPEKYLINSRKKYEKEIEYNNSLAESIQNMEIDAKDREVYLNKKIQSDQIITSYKSNLLTATNLLKEYPNGIIIGGALIIKYDNAAYILAEGYDNKYKNLNPGFLLKWQLINDYTEENLKYINLSAIAGNFEKDNKYSILNESKLGFNSIVTEYIGEFDVILNSFSYNLYQKMNK